MSEARGGQPASQAGDTQRRPRPPIRRIVIEGSPGRLGKTHGERFRDEIQRYGRERVRLATDGSWAGVAAGADEVMALADAMLPAHRDYAEDLYTEMVALGDASGLSPAEMVIVGGFTDFVDAVRRRGGSMPEEDDCTAAIVPDTRAGGAGFLAQTWDMHDSATDHVVLLDLHADGQPRALVFSTVGCVGQIGMNEAGIAVGINNLSTVDGQVGVTWPFVVRKALQQTDIESALACVTQAHLAGAHNYLLFDRHGRGYNVEAMPGGCSVEKLEQRVILHTNHCLAPEACEREATKPPALLDSSLRRLHRAARLLEEGSVSAESLMELTRDPEICQRPQAPHHMESSGAAIMRPASGDFWAVWGVPIDNEYQRFQLGRA
jgi:isopenicillin-N N-acyltransferase-like protein